MCQRVGAAPGRFRSKADSCHESAVSRASCTSDAVDRVSCTYLEGRSMKHHSPQTPGGNFTARLSLIVALCLVLSNSAMAQTVTSSMQSRVNHVSGAATPEASLSAVNTDTGVSKKVNASASG